MDISESSKVADPTLITGPLVLGYMFSTGLYGILCVQVFVYHSSFPKDPKWIKIYVTLVFLLETVFSIFSTIEAWNTLGKGWGDPKRLTYLDWSATPQPVLCGVVTSMAHGFYCWRIMKLATSGRLVPSIIVAVIAMISITQLVATWIVTVCFGISGPDLATLRKVKDVVAVWLISAAAADIIIAVAMVTILMRARSTIGVFQPTASMIQGLVRMVIETGVITSCAAIMDCTLFLVFSTTNLHFIMFYMLAKLYSNSLMATLNSRVLSNRLSTVRGGAKSTAFWQDLESSAGDEPGTRRTSTTLSIKERPLGASNHRRRRWSDASSHMHLPVQIVTESFTYTNSMCRKPDVKNDVELEPLSLESTNANAAFS